MGAGCKIRGLDHFFRKSFYWKTSFFYWRIIFLTSESKPEWAREHFPILKSKIEFKNAKLFFHHFLSSPLILQPVNRKNVMRGAEKVMRGASRPQPPARLKIFDTNSNVYVECLICIEITMT